jgi:hypothetical protein
LENNKKNRLLVKIYAKTYCNLLDLKFGKIRFVYSKKKFHKLLKKYGYKKHKLSKYYGVTMQKERIVFINLKDHKTNKKLKDTIAHELLHIAIRKLKHGKLFQSITNTVVREELR